MSLSYINVSISITLLETLVTTKVNLVLEIIYKKNLQTKVKNNINFFIVIVKACEVLVTWLLFSTIRVENQHNIFSY